MAHEMKSVYEILGEARFEQLVAGFYQYVSADPILRPLYPDEDMEGAERRLRLFLIQYFGGPTTYSEERGHPRLRMRHAPYRIGVAERDAWLRCMLSALDEIPVSQATYETLKTYFVNTAQFMRNDTSFGGMIR